MIMDAGLLYNVIRDVANKLRDNNVPGYLQNIVDGLKTVNNPNVNGTTRNNVLATLERQILDLLTIIPTIIPQKQSVEINRIFSHLGYSDLFGDKGERAFKEGVRNLYTNPISTAQIFGDYLNHINTILAVHGGLSYYDEKLSTIDNTTDKNLIVLSFKGNVEINNLDELSKASSRWNQVLLGFALLANENNTNFRVEKIERGSIILTISAVYGVVCLFAKGANDVLDVVKKYYEIRKSAADLKSLKMPALKDTIADLESKAELKAEEEAKVISDELLSKIEVLEEDKTKVEKAINNSIQHLLEFVWNGGKVDVKLIATTADDKEIEVNLSVKHKDIKQIENKINELEDKDSIQKITEGDSNSVVP